MRWLFRWAFRLLILLVVLIIGAFLLLDIIAREITEHRIRQQTGLDVKIGKMQVGLWNPRLTIENLVIYNSAEFGGSPLMELPELHLEYNRSPLFYTHFHFTLVRVNLARFNLVEDVKGRKNIEVLGKRLEQSKNAAGKANAGKSPETEFPRIDTLNLSLGHATYVQMKNPGTVNQLNLDVRNQIFTNIKNEADLQGVGMVLLLKSGNNIFANGGDPWLNLLGPSKKK